MGTIDAGLDRIRRMFQQMAAENRAMVSGQEAAEMFQTHGFPPELFEAMAAERNLLFDWDGFRREMEQHGIDSGGGKKAELFTRSALDAIRTVNPPTRFLGYDTMVETDAKVIGVIANGQLVDVLDEIGHQQPVVVVLDKTPFYGEMGGQVGDAWARSPPPGCASRSRAPPSSTASSSTMATSARARSASGPA